MLEIEYADGSRMIINRHGAAREIWVAARAGGFHFRWDGGVWRDTRDGTELFAALSRLVSAQSGSRGGAALLGGRIAAARRIGSGSTVGAGLQHFRRRHGFLVEELRHACALSPGSRGIRAGRHHDHAVGGISRGISGTSFSTFSM